MRYGSWFQRMNRVGNEVYYHSMEQSPSGEYYRISASQEITRILCYPKIYYRVYQNRPPIPIRSRINPVHSLLSNLLKNRINIILPFTFGSSMWSLSVRFPKQISVCTSHLPHTCCMTCPSHSS